MRKSAYLLVLLANLYVMPSIAPADDEVIVNEGRRGIPVQTAVLTRRYGAVETEDEVAGAELEAGYGATNTFQTVGWRRWAWGPYGGYGVYGPRYHVGYRPRYYGYYPGAYWGGYYGGPHVSYYGGYGYGGYGGYGYGGYGGYGYGGYGGCYYW